MNPRKYYSLFIAAIIFTARFCFGDATISSDEYEKAENVIGVNDYGVDSVPAGNGNSTPSSPDRHEALNEPVNKTSGWKNPDSRFCISVVGDMGLFGYFNVNQTFVPGIITLGVTPCFDVRIDHYFHIGAEYMILWGKPDTTDAARFIMNANVRFRLSVPVHPKTNIEALIIGGASIWPKADTTSVLESTFFEDRFGWNVQPALGVDYKVTRHWSVIFTAGYLVNTTVVKEITITHDMMLLTLGPRFRF